MINVERVIHESDDVRRLVLINEEIKGLVTDPNLSWQERVKLYKMVQLMNEKITELLGN